MKFQEAITVKEIAQLIGAEIKGDENVMVHGLNELHKVESGDLMFVDAEKYFQRCLDSPASVILLPSPVDCPPGKALLISKQPFKDYNFLAKKFRPAQKQNTLIHPTAEIHSDAFLEGNVVVGAHSKIGKGSHLRANVVIGSHVEIGEDVIIHPNTVIGGDAFYYHKGEEGYTKWHTCGRVLVQDQVEIGCNTTIDKGVSGDTIIGEGTKIDNLVHLGHGVVIGKHCIIAAQVGIAGKTIVEDHVTIYGQAGLSKSIRIGSGTTISAKAGVSKSLEGNRLYFGIPAEEARTKFRELAALRRLPAFMKEVQKKLKGL